MKIWLRGEKGGREIIIFLVNFRHRFNYNRCLQRTKTSQNHGIDVNTFFNISGKVNRCLMCDVYWHYSCSEAFQSACFNLKTFPSWYFFVPIWYSKLAFLAEWDMVSFLSPSPVKNLEHNVIHSFFQITFYNWTFRFTSISNIRF